MHFYPPIWRLIIEWRVSLAFPAMALLFVWSLWATGIIAIAAALAISMPPVSLIMAGAFDIPGPYFYAAFFSTFFVAGTFIAAYRLRLVLFFRRWPLARHALLAVCIYYLCLRSTSNDPSATTAACGIRDHRAQNGVYGHRG
ncbi:peptidoglycan/LPS O-acetylase OafA/YrhL [Bradyrhizobium sp. USDA 3311]